MTAEHPCARALEVQAAHDSELDALQTAAIAAHCETCSECAGLRDDLAALSARLRDEVEYTPAPAAFREKLQARLRAETPAPAGAVVPFRPRQAGSWRRLAEIGAGFGVGAAAAAAAVLLLVAPAGPGLDDLVVADHVRALQPGHLLDIVSNNQHNVRPWFNGRIDFAPPVKNLADAGFPLTGGRLDYLNGRTIAVMVYQRRLHPIEMLVWPANGAADTEPVRSSRNGYTLYHWTQGGMTIWVISDLIDPELGEFVADWRK